MTLMVDLTPEEADRLAETAKARGVSVDTLVRSFLRQIALGASNSIDSTVPPALPKWPGRVIGDLRREDIYEDVR